MLLLIDLLDRSHDLAPHDLGEHQFVRLNLIVGEVTLSLNHQDMCKLFCLHFIQHAG